MSKLIEITDPDKLTLKQRKWLDSWKKHGNNTQAAKDAGYKANAQNTFEVIGSQNFRKLRPIIREWLDNVALSNEAIEKKIKEGLTVKETKLFVIDGKITEHEVPARAIQQRYLDMASKVRGIYSTGPGESEDKPLHIKVLDRFDAKEPEKESPQDAPQSTKSG